MNRAGQTYISRRMRLFLTVATILALVFAVRLVDFQIVRAEAISEYSYENRAVTRTIPAVRGDIVDANGNVLATTVYRYDINAAPSMVGPVERVTDGVSQVISVEEVAADLARILQEDISILLPKLSGTSNYVNLKKGLMQKLIVKSKNSAFHGSSLTLIRTGFTPMGRLPET